MCVFLFYSFAATKNELHEFSPTKEPLLSMLEGEIQTMYMCKPGEGLSVLAGSTCAGLSQPVCITGWPTTLSEAWRCE